MLFTASGENCLGAPRGHEGVIKKLSYISQLHARSHDTVLTHSAGGEWAVEDLWSALFIFGFIGQHNIQSHYCPG